MTRASKGGGGIRSSHPNTELDQQQTKTERSTDDRRKAKLRSTPHHLSTDTDEIDYAALAHKIRSAHKGRAAREAQHTYQEHAAEIASIQNNPIQSTAPVGNGVWPPDPVDLLDLMRGLLVAMGDTTSGPVAALEAVNRARAVVQNGTVSNRTLASELRGTSFVVASLLEQQSLLSVRSGAPISPDLEEPFRAEVVATIEEVKAESSGRMRRIEPHSQYVQLKRLLTMLTCVAKDLAAQTDQAMWWAQQAGGLLEKALEEPDTLSIAERLKGREAWRFNSWLGNILPHTPIPYEYEDAAAAEIAHELLKGEGTVPISHSAAYVQFVAAKVADKYTQLVGADTISMSDGPTDSRKVVGAIERLVEIRRTEDIALITERLDAEPMLSLEEIRRSLAVERPHLTAGYVQHLKELLPHLHRVTDRAGDEPNLVLAAHLAFRMLSAPAGYTQQQLVSDFRDQCPELDLYWPGFGVDDIEALRTAYCFIPAWANGINSNPQLSIEQLPKPLVEQLTTFRKIPFDSVMLHEMRDKRGARGSLHDTVLAVVEKPVADAVAYFRHLVCAEQLAGNNSYTDQLSLHQLVWKDDPKNSPIPAIVERCFGIEGVQARDERDLLRLCREMIVYAPTIAAKDEKILAVHLLGTPVWEELDRELEKHPELPVMAVSHTTSDADEVRASRRSFANMALVLMADSEAKATWERQMFSISFAGILGSLYQKPGATIDQVRGRDFLVVGHAGNIIGPATAKALDGLQCHYDVCDLKYNDGTAIADKSHQVFADPASWAVATKGSGAVVNCTADHVLSPEALLCSDEDLHYFNLGTGTKDRSLVAQLASDVDGSENSHYEGIVGTVQNRRYVIPLPALDIHRRLAEESKPVDLEGFRIAQRWVDQYGYGEARWLAERCKKIAGASAPMSELATHLEDARTDWRQLDESTRSLVTNVKCELHRSVTMMGDGDVFNFADIYPNPTPFSDFISCLKTASFQDARHRLDHQTELGPEVLQSIKAEYRGSETPHVTYGPPGSQLE